VTSRETTEARAAARAAEANWKAHHGSCPRCTRAVRSRQWDDLCRWGSDIYQEHRNAKTELARNRRLDKLPAPDQEALFPG
jgi:hypothetical protein